MRDAIPRHSGLIAILRNHGVESALATAQALGAGAADTAAQMRIERSGVSLILAIADLAGLLTFEQAVAQLTAFADRALEGAIRTAVRERTGIDNPTGFTALALGKQGSRELNYSSDIDPIFLYDPATLPARPREEAGQAAVRIARRVVELLQTRTQDGYVLRVDLRLRPSPEVFPIALPVDAALVYYESSALPWERAAFVRARAAAGDLALGTGFLAAIEPFVWRRSLDFGAIAEITGISRRIRDDAPDSQEFGPGYDLKRGRGGIREIEFFAQIHQLIHGGRDPALRVPATLDALGALGRAGRVSARTARELADAYRLFRTVEHRLQMVDDRQTHSLPQGDALDGVARLHGLEGGRTLLELMAPHIERVRVAYDLLAGDAGDGSRLPIEAEALEPLLRASGFAKPDRAVQQIAEWRRGRARSLRSPDARTAFEAMLPGLVEAIGHVPDPVNALGRFGDIVDALPSGINMYRLLQARPALIGMLAEILGHAPALAEQLARRPELLDGLIDASSLDLPPAVSELRASFERGWDAADYESCLDGIRRRVNEWRFALGVQLIAGGADPLAVAAGYARVAEAALGALAGAAVGQFAAIHGSVPGCELAIIGLGRLGGGALTHASDLDLVYVFTGGIDAQSDGDKSLRATDYYNRLARRVTAALSIPTAAGPLYEVDTRMRPSGIHGMLAVSLAAFGQYQRTEAWTFEHMAMTRARTVFGSPQARCIVDAEIAAVVAQPRDRANVMADFAALRSEMARHKPPKGPFDIKLGDGGLVDLEFAVQARQLLCGRGLSTNLADAIAKLAAEGLIPSSLASAERLLARLLVVLRLVAPSGETPEPASRALVAKACGASDWTEMVVELDEARRTVAEVWRTTLAEGVAC